MTPDPDGALSLTERVKAALAGGDFILYSQVIQSLADGGEQRPLREILIRLREEEEKMLPPGTFFPILRENGLLPYLDRWVVSYLVKRAAATQAEKPDLPLTRNSINLSADTLRSDRFGAFVQKRVSGARLPEGTVSFEVSWEDAMRHAQLLQALKDELRPAGCTFCVAGFDGSRPAFTIIRVLGPDYVKFSYGLTQNVARSLADSENAEAVNARCHEIGIQTIAEHVESDAVLDHLKLIGVDYAQGIAISPPKLMK
jgi:EAL domain-containing protein (putative c-di-GMP-specific phosphodiesterase class I)